MGIEWMNKVGKTFDRSCQRGYRSITAGYLFDPAVSPVERSFKAKFFEGKNVPNGTQIFVRAEADGVRLYNTDESAIGLPEGMSSWLIEKLQGTPQGIAVGVVEEFRPLSHVADIVIQ